MRVVSCDLLRLRCSCVNALVFLSLIAHSYTVYIFADGKCRLKGGRRLVCVCVCLCVRGLFSTTFDVSIICSRHERHDYIILYEVLFHARRHIESPGSGRSVHTHTHIHSCLCWEAGVFPPHLHVASSSFFPWHSPARCRQSLRDDILPCLLISMRAHKIKR